MTVGLSGVVPRFFDWWFGEMLGLVPDALKLRFARTTERVVLFADDAAAGLYFETGEDIRLLGRFALGGATSITDVRDTLRRHSLDRSIAAGRAEICLRIAAAKTLRAEMTLPLAAERNVDEVVSFELDRHTPFRADQVLFASRVIERNLTTQRLRVEVLLVPRSTVEELVGIAQRLDLQPHRIDIAAESGHQAASGNMLRGGAKSAAGRRDAALLYGLAGLAVILAVVAAVLPVERARQAEYALARQFAAVRHIAVREAALRTEIDALRKSELFLIQKKRSAPTVSALLFETTRLIPDTTWIDDWRFSGNELQLQGVSQSASALVGILEQSKFFSHTTFLSPVTRDSGGREHFAISTEVTAGTER